MKLSTGMGLGAYASCIEETIGLIHSAGFRHMDLGFPGPVCTTGFYAEDEGEFNAYIKRVTERCKELGMDFVQSHAPMGKPLKGDEDAKRLIQVTKYCIRAAGALNIPHVVVHSGYLPNISKDECFELNKVFFDELLVEAEKYGVNVLVENFNKMSKEDTYWIDNATDLRRMIDLVDHPLFHAVWDAGHANLQEMPQHEELALLGDHVLALHVQDNKGDRDTHLMPFFGTLNLDDLMRGLKDIGYKGAFNFEVASMTTPPAKRRQYEADTRLLRAPLAVRLAEEKLLYEVGKSILTAYDLFEE